MNGARSGVASIGLLSFVVAMSLAVAGCSDPNGAGTCSGSAGNDGASAAAKTEGTTDTSPKVADPSEVEPVQTAQAAPSTNDDAAVSPVADRSDPAPAAAEEDPYEADQRRRRQAEDMIYATIRIKMEEMIERRADLLAEGRDPTDVEIRQLEGSIMKARNLLMEAGEIVEDLQPPIVVRAPKQ